MLWEGVTSHSAGSAFFHDALVGPPLLPDRTHLRPGRAEAGVERSSPVSESTFLKFADSDLLIGGRGSESSCPQQWASGSGCFSHKKAAAAEEVPAPQQGGQGRADGDEGQALSPQRGQIGTAEATSTAQTRVWRAMTAVEGLQTHMML